MRSLLLAPLLVGALAGAEDPLAGLHAHPRLLLTAERAAEIIAQRATDPRLDQLCNKIAERADLVCTLPPSTYHIEGDLSPRLLDVSRETLARMLALGVAWRFDPQVRWRERLLGELDAVCAFRDWHPAHFLDTAEMTTAVAIAYDWLYDTLDEAQRTRYRQAIVTLGLKPGSEKGWWVRSTNNWNQVCHAGMVLGALAVADDERDLATALVARALRDTETGLHAYAPAGVYPEGPGYWSYGTSYTVLTCAALSSALGTDHGLSTTPGLAASYDWLMQAMGPTGRTMNYADSGERLGQSPTHLWAAQTWKRPDFAAYAWEGLDRWIASKPETKMGDRFLPLAAVWWSDTTHTHTPPLLWSGAGESPVHIALMRSAWNDPSATFTGLKAGELKVNHGHLDVGEFVLDADGVRWAYDLGMEKDIYSRKDSWGLTQDAKRWKYLRVNNRAHNVLTIGDALQRVDGVSPLVKIGNDEQPLAVANLTAAYAGQAKQVNRGIALLGERRQLLIRDEIDTATADIRWTMIIRAETDIAADGRSVILRDSEKHMTLRLIEAPASARFRVADLKPPTAVENQNDGYSRLLIDIPMPVPATCVLAVLATPGEADAATPLAGTLTDWPGTAP